MIFMPNATLTAAYFFFLAVLRFVFLTAFLAADLVFDFAFFTMLPS